MTTGYTLGGTEIAKADAPLLRIRVNLAPFLTDPMREVIAADALEVGSMQGMPVTLGWDGPTVGQVVDAGVHMATVWADVELPNPGGDEHVQPFWDSVRLQGHGAHEWAPGVQIIERVHDEKHNVDVVKRFKVLAVAVGASPVVDGRPIGGLAAETGPVGVRDDTLPPAAARTDETTEAADRPPDGYASLLTPAGEARRVPVDAVDALLAAGWTLPPEPYRPGVFG